MSLVDATKLLEDYDNVLKGASKNSTCLYRGCSNKPISSHIIAEKTLRLISDNNKVLAWKHNISVWDMARSMNAGQPLKYLYAEPIEFGIREKRNVTFPLFCSIHDRDVFAPLERNDFFCTGEQVLLLAYRALSASLNRAQPTEELFTVSKKHGYVHLLSTPERLPRLLRFQAKGVIREAHQRYEDLLLGQDYQQLGWAMYTVNMPLAIASTNALIPVTDNEREAVINGKQSLTAEDVITFSFFPNHPHNNSIGVICWLFNSHRAHRFLELRNIHKLSEKELLDDFLALAFESPDIYISPTWWHSLSREQKRAYMELHLNAGREDGHLV